MVRGRQHTGRSMVGRLRQRGRGARREPDLTSLINIVFLILVFFVVAGALRPFSARDVMLAKVGGRDLGAVSPGHLIVRRDGSLTYRGREVSLEALLELVAQQASRRAGGGAPEVLTIVADGRLPAKRLIHVSRQLKAAGAGRLAIMVERAGQ